MLAIRALFGRRPLRVYCAGRADRQPEFTQLDMEMSFVCEEDVMAMVEACVKAAWRASVDEPGQLDKSFRRLTYRCTIAATPSDRATCFARHRVDHVGDVCHRTPARR